MRPTGFSHTCRRHDSRMLMIACGAGNVTRQLISVGDHGQIRFLSKARDPSMLFLVYP